VLLRLLDWLCARWLRRYEGDLPVSKTVVPDQTHAASRLSTCRYCNQFLGHGHECSQLYLARADAAPPVPTQGREADVPAHLKVGSLTPLADALSKPIVLPDVPKQTVTVTGEWEQQTKDYGVSVEADVDIGKPGGWSTGGKGGYWKDKGAAVMGWFQWKGKR
jgi:hypothetical protein